MVFFTLTLKLSSNLPGPLRHNVPGSFHAGDIVLPMFLFASGLSLAHYIENRKSLESCDFIKGIIGRFGKLALIGVSLSYFSAHGLFEMDEVMLSAICFLACIFLSRLNWKIALVIILLIDLSYLLLIKFDHTYIFSRHYLGGYLSAFYYLPVMLSGLYAGRNMIIKDRPNYRAVSMENTQEKHVSANNLLFMSGVLVLFLLSLLYVPIDKLVAAPAFMMLSILVSFLLFIVISNIKFKNPIVEQIEYLGKNPLRFWMMMYMLMIIPAIIYLRSTDGYFPLYVPWLIGIFISLTFMFLLWGLSLILDKLKD